MLDEGGSKSSNLMASFDIESIDFISRDASDSIIADLFVSNKMVDAVLFLPASSLVESLCVDDSVSKRSLSGSLRILASVELDS